MVYPGLFNASYTPAPLEVKFILDPAGYLSPYLFAIIFSYMLGGLIIAQAVSYFQSFRQQDERGLQLHVLLVLALTALKLAQVAAVGYLDFALFYGDYLFLTHKHWTLHISVLTATLVSATVQVFFIRRVFVLSHHNVLVLAPIALAWLASIASAIWVTAVFPTNWAARSADFVLAGRVAPACTLAVDALVTCTTAWYLSRARAAFPGESPVSRLLRVTLESAAPPLAVAIVNVALNDQAAGGYVFFCVALTPLLQTMSMLYSLNSRIYFRAPSRESRSLSTGLKPLDGPPGSPFPSPFVRSSGSESPTSAARESRVSFLPFNNHNSLPRSPRSADTAVGSWHEPAVYAPAHASMSSV